MARRSPRSRRKPERTPRVPGSGRPRPTPGRTRAAVRKRARTASAKHERARVKRAGSPRRASGTHPTRAARAARARRPATAPRPRAARAPDPERLAALLGILARLYPDARCALDHRNALELLIATILSAQCTDERVNKVTPALFERYPDAAAFAGADPDELEAMIRSTGFFRNKARSIRECCADIMSKFGGQVPRTLEELTTLRGVGRKTANVVLGNAYGVPGLVVDTHVTRLSNRLGLTREKDAVKIEFALMPLVPREQWTLFSHWLILHGRRVCIARKPRCSVCPLRPHCPQVGVSLSE
jgi:endonuclease-3